MRNKHDSGWLGWAAPIFAVSLGVFLLLDACDERKLKAENRERKERLRVPEAPSVNTRGVYR